MTTVSSIILSAYRESNLTPLGTSPTANQQTEAFSLLSSIVASVLGNAAGENLSPFPLGSNEINSPAGYPWWSNQLPANMYIPTNSRVMCNLTGAGTINLHPRPHDGARMGVVDVSQNFDIYPLTIYGNGRSIEGDDQLVLNTAGQIRQWIYREDLGNWVTVLPLDAAGDMPWPEEFDDMFIILLALRLNPRYGQTMSPASIEMLKDVKKNFSARYAQATTQMPSEDGLLYLTKHYGTFNRQWSDSSNAFNSGYPL